MTDQASSALQFAIVGPGRAGESFRMALVATGAVCVDVIGRDDDPTRLDPMLDLVLIATPDHAIESVSDRIPIGPVVAHVSGATTLAPLRRRHERCGSLHPLMSLPDPITGAALLRAGANLAVAGADLGVVRELLAVAERLEAVPFVVDDEHRPSYHAAASIAANHLVGLAAQVERVAEHAGVGLPPFLAMMRAVLDNIERNGTTASLTGPVARADWATVATHLDAIGDEERPLYLALAAACAEIAGHPLPPALLPHALTDASEESP